METITTEIWDEDAHSDYPFVANQSRCCGFDIYGDLLKRASYIEYLYLLLMREPPSVTQALLLESLSIALANPGPRDHSVRAAMNAAVGGSTRASALIAALSVGAGNLGGAREVFCAVDYWHRCGLDLQAWRQLLDDPPAQQGADIWLPMEHAPGFDPNGSICPRPVLQTLECLEELGGTPALQWLRTNRTHLESVTQCPLAFSGVAAVTFYDLGLAPEQAEMLYLLMRLPGAAAHALEQEKLGWKNYPFFAEGVTVTKD